MIRVSEGRRFTRESFTYIVGELLSKSLSIFLLPVYASYLSESDVGIILLIGTIWPLLFTMLGRGFSTYILRGYHDISDGPRFFGTILIFSMSAALSIGLLIHLTGPWISGLVFKNHSYKPYLQYAVFYSVFRLFFAHVLSIYRTRRKALMSVVLSTILFAANTAAVLIAIYGLKTDLSGILNAQLISYGVVTLIYIAVLTGEVSLRWMKGIIRPAIRFALPLVPHALSGWILVYISAIILENNAAETELSVYMMAQRLALILAIINVAFNQGWSPFIYANYQKANFKDLLQTNGRKLIVFTMFVCGMISLFSKEMLLIMQKESFMAARKVLPILLVAYVFQLFYMIYAVHIFYHKNTRIISVISILSGLVAIFLNLRLIPLWGMYGGAVCTLISFAMMALLAYLYSLRYIRARIIDWKLVVFVFSLAAFITGVYLISDTMGIVPALVVKLGTGAVIFAVMQWLGLFNLKSFIQSLVKGS